MKSKDKKLTSVRIAPELFFKFKQLCIENEFSFQKLAERSLYLYITDATFKSKLHSTKVKNKIGNEE